MAKKWVNAGFKSRGDAIEHCVHKGRVMIENDTMTVFFDHRGDFRSSNNYLINLKHNFWNSFETMMIEVDEPVLEFGKVYQVSDSGNFDNDAVCVARFREFDDSGLFVTALGTSWKYYREIPAELIGRIK